MKGRIFLIHWNQVEGEAHADVLRQLGWEVEMECKDGSYACKRIKASPPDVIMIYLTRNPAQGAATVAYLVASRLPREIPILLVGGSPEKLEQIRETAPDVIHAEPWEIGPALESLVR